MDNPTIGRIPVATVPVSPTSHRTALIGFALFCAAVSLLCFKPLLTLFRFALDSDLYSYTLIIPFITGNLIWRKRRELAAQPVARSPVLALTIFVLGLLAMGAAEWSIRAGHWEPAQQDHLFFAMVAYVILLVAGGLFFFGRALLRLVALPIGTLFFLAPLPVGLETGFEAFLQHASAHFSALLFRVAGIPVLQDKLLLVLPGIRLEVAPECSGMRSSLVLLITSILAGYLFLTSPWKRSLLALVVVPLAVLRNGFRIFTIGALCVHIHPDMINSWLHRQGGPVFFALSLVPLFGLMLILRRMERSGSSESKAVKPD